MYGKVEGVMTEQTPFHPYSKKGEIRAQIATMLLNELKAGNLTALIARSADFYGPRARTGIPMFWCSTSCQGRESELACQRFCEAFVHLHAGRRAESGAAGGEAKAPGIKHGTFLLLPIRRPGNSSLSFVARSSERNRSTACSPGRCSGWQGGSIRRSENCTRCFTSTNSTTSSIQQNSRRRSAFSRLLTPKASAEQPKPTNNRRSLNDHQVMLRQKVK